MKQLIDFCIKMSQNEIIGNDCQRILGIEKRIGSRGIDRIITQIRSNRPYLYTQMIDQMRPKVIKALSETSEFPLEDLKCPKKGPLFLLYFHLIHTKLELEQPFIGPTPSQTREQLIEMLTANMTTVISETFDMQHHPDYQDVMQYRIDSLNIFQDDELMEECAEWSAIIKMGRIHEVWIGKKAALPVSALGDPLHEMLSILLRYTASNLLLTKIIRRGIREGHPFAKIITTNESAVIPDLIPDPTKTHLDKFILLPNAVFSNFVYIVNSTKNEAYVMQLQAPLIDDQVGRIRSHLRDYYHDELSMLVIADWDYRIADFKSKLCEYTKLKINGMKYEGTDSPFGICEINVFIRPNEDSLFIYTTIPKGRHYESKLSELMEGDNRLHSCRLDVEEHTPAFNPMMG